MNTAQGANWDLLLLWKEEPVPAVGGVTLISAYTEEHFGAAQARRAAIAIYDTADFVKEMPHPG